MVGLDGLHVYYPQLTGAALLLCAQQGRLILPLACFPLEAEHQKTTQGERRLTDGP